MLRLNSRGIGMLMAVGLIAAGSSLVACGSEDNGPKNEGGTGGAGGIGGTDNEGGSGGTGPELCGGAICVDGESCVKARCECTTLPEDSCTAANPDKVCNPNKICVDKDPEPAEFRECRNLGEVSEDGQLTCSNALGGRSWLRSCETTSDCAIDFTVCMNERSEGEVPFCMYNYCGTDNIERNDQGQPILDGEGEPILLNGEAWGACDTVTGLTEGAEELTGSCIPLDGGSRAVFLCVNTGDLGPGETCRLDAGKDDPEGLCGAGLRCGGNNLQRTLCQTDENCPTAMACTLESGGRKYCDFRECEQDADCGSGNYCHEEAKFCLQLNYCQERCNAGTDGGENGGCSQEESEQFCAMSFSNPAALEWPDAQGVCMGECDVLDEGACTGPGGRPQRCAPAGTFFEPTAGLCVDATEERSPPGGPCGGRNPACADGSACTTQGTCVALCDCSSRSWSVDGVCQQTTEQCSASESCVSAFEGNPRLGICITRD